jgi:hypothetical protein
MAITNHERVGNQVIIASVDDPISEIRTHQAPQTSCRLSRDIPHPTSHVRTYIAEVEKKVRGSDLPTEEQERLASWLR